MARLVYLPHREGERHEEEREGERELVEQAEDAGLAEGHLSMHSKFSTAFTSCAGAGDEVGKFRSRLCYRTNVT